MGLRQGVTLGQRKIKRNHCAQHLEEEQLCLMAGSPSELRHGFGRMAVRSRSSAWVDKMAVVAGLVWSTALNLQEALLNGANDRMILVM